MSFYQKEQPACELDVYEGDENENPTPGPGQYYNPEKSTCFRKEPTSESLQFFGSTVERFANRSKANNVEVGPSTYDISNKVDRRRLVNPTIYSGFTSAAERFPAAKTEDDMPGPGAYLEPSMSQHLSSKMNSKKPAIFGSMQPRFPALKLKDLKPGPGAYHVEKSNNRDKSK